MFGKKIPETKKDLARALLKAGSSYREVADALDISIGSVHNIMKEPVEAIEGLAEEIKRGFLSLNT